jgi:hypothetical protein
MEGLMTTQAEEGQDRRMNAYMAGLGTSAGEENLHDPEAEEDCSCRRCCRRNAQVSRRRELRAEY